MQNISKGSLEVVIDGNVYRLLRDSFNKCPHCQKELEFDVPEIASELTDSIWTWLQNRLKGWICVGTAVTDAILNADKELRRQK